jgi:hypothetical protein
MGNSRARAVYEALLSDNFRRPQTDSGLENFIRAKYEQKKYIAREWIPPPFPPKGKHVCELKLLFADLIGIVSEFKNNGHFKFEKKILKFKILKIQKIL